VLSFTRAALVVKVSGGFTRDLQALPWHLAALPGHLKALPGNLAALPGSPILLTQRLPRRLQALAAVDNLSLTDPGFSKPWPE